MSSMGAAPSSARPPDAFLSRRHAESPERANVNKPPRTLRPVPMSFDVIVRVFPQLPRGKSSQLVSSPASPCRFGAKRKQSKGPVVRRLEPNLQTEAEAASTPPHGAWPFAACLVLPHGQWSACVNKEGRDEVAVSRMDLPTPFGVAALL